MATSAAEVINLPQDVLENTPAAPPPTAADSVFIRHNTKTAAEVAVASVFLALASIFFLTRIYTKFFIIRKPGWDDLTCFLGLLSSVGCFTGFVWSNVYGPSGKHNWNISLADAFGYSETIGLYLQSVCISPALGFIKISFFLLYYHVFWPMRWMRITAYAGVSITAAFYGSMLVAFLAFSTPRSGESWKTLLFSLHMRRTKDLEFPLASIGLVIDVCLLVLPIHPVLQLQLGKKQRLGVMTLFVMGLLACVASSMNLYFRKLGLDHNNDYWILADVELMALLEVYVGTCCVCMPYVKKMLSERAPFKSASAKICSLVGTFTSKKDASAFSFEKMIKGNGSRPSTERIGLRSPRSDLSLGNHSGEKDDGLGTHHAIPPPPPTHFKS